MTFEALASKEYKEEEAIEAVYHINKVRVLSQLQNTADAATANGRNQVEKNLTSLVMCEVNAN